MNKGNHQVWECKIGITNHVVLPNGADWPMREAVIRAFREIAGIEAEFCFSGWGGSLTDSEAGIVAEVFEKQEKS